MSLKRYKKRLHSAKKAARSELKGDGWTKHNYYDWFDTSFNSIKDNVERIDCRKVSCEEFIEK